jgi:hypothetical protein
MCPRLFKELRHATHLCLGCFASKRCKTIVAAALVTNIRLRPLTLPQLDDETLLEQPLDGTVQRAGAQTQFAAGSLRDILHDSITVLIALGERYQNVKRLRA